VFAEWGTDPVFCEHAGWSPGTALADRRELGYLIGGRDRWNRGLGTLVARAGLAHGFDVLRLQTIWAEAVDANAASAAILRRIGMRETGLGGETEFLGVRSRYRQFELSEAEFAAGSA